MLRTNAWKHVCDVGMKSGPSIPYGAKGSRAELWRYQGGCKGFVYEGDLRYFIPQFSRLNEVRNAEQDAAVDLLRKGRDLVEDSQHSQQLTYTGLLADSLVECSQVDTESVHEEMEFVEDSRHCQQFTVSSQDEPTCARRGIDTPFIGLSDPPAVFGRSAMEHEHELTCKVDDDLFEDLYGCKSVDHGASQITPMMEACLILSSTNTPSITSRS